MTDDLEQLSRLLDGDLPPDEERALRARIEREPALAEAWARMRGLARDLDGLITSARSDPERPEFRPLGSPSPNATAGRSLSGTSSAAGWALAAAILVGVLAWRATEPSGRVALLEGTHRLEGRVDALAGVVPIAVDGVAVVTVEPPQGVARGTGAEDPMTRSHVASALAGAALTVAVYEGRATLARADGPPLVVEAGQTASVEGADLRPRSPAGPPADPVGIVTGEPPADLSALRAENERLRQQLAEASFAGALARGQLAAIEGEPVPWPDDAPPGMRPEAFERALRARLAGRPGAELVAVECEEYPCVAVFDGAGDERSLADLPKSLVPDVMGDLPAGVAVMAARDGDAPDAPTTVGFAILPAANGEIDPDLSARVDHRARRLLEESTGAD